MSDKVAYYAVYLYPTAAEALGDPIKPYLTGGPAGEHVVCRAIDVSGAFFQMTIPGNNAEGKPVELEIMIPHAMVRLVISLHGEEDFGFA